ncbi:acetylxylan esterase [Agromyces aerolatus]|uniref:acetylxylan esterase n=1 Tax=Agromyces sp. LY-1074 TaxID=3074080 RepID=UPI00285F7947|nr:MULTISPECIES: acetylxylan esterase [unclassified Agromyces]MDR5701370.1 acetylxylan esterase [Agromyces sp. LY-1074]MDR5706841.1 acetylxylan esterase [Agromyces sp. LY-1358]
MTAEESAVTSAEVGAFWAEQVDAAPEGGLHRRDRVATRLRGVEVWDVEFSGADGHPVRGWLSVPASPAGAVVEFLPYGYGRGRPLDSPVWAACGFVHLVMDVRGQGSQWRSGDTPDPVGSGPSAPGFLTRGLHDPREHYLRRLTIDAVRAVDALSADPSAAQTPVFVTGRSQGGALALAAAGLAPRRARTVAGAGVQAPFLAAFRQSARTAATGPYTEIAEWGRMHPDRVASAFRTLDHFDAIGFAERASAVPVFFSIGMRDAVCPPESMEAVIAAHHGRKSVRRWPFAGHEAGATRDLEALVAVAAALAHRDVDRALMEWAHCVK